MIYKLWSILKKVKQCAKKKIKQYVMFKIRKIMPESSLYPEESLLKSNIYIAEINWEQTLVQYQNNDFFTDRKGNIIPWISYPCIHFLNTLQYANSRIFEWGTGSSSLYWLSKEPINYVGLEYNEEWKYRVDNELQSKGYKNWETPYYSKDSLDYIEHINSYKNDFDVIVIDGRQRVKCAKEAAKKLAHGGIIVWDDTERDFYQDGVQALCADGFFKIDFYGLKVGVNASAITSVFFKNTILLPCI